MQEAATQNVGIYVKRHNPSALLNSSHLGWSQISLVEPGPLAFLSGQTGIPHDRSEVPGSLGGQASIIAGNLAAALRELGASPSEVVLLRLLVVNATTDRFTEAWAPIRDMLDGEQPSLTGIGVSALWLPALQMEVEMVVRVPGGELPAST